MPGKQRDKSYSRQYTLWRQITAKKRAVAYLGGVCRKCKYDKCIAALSFHHRDPNEKEFSWDEIRNRSWSIIEAELDKCDLLCCNCHMEHHWDEQAFLDAEKAVEEAQKRRFFPLPRRVCEYCEKTFKPKRSEQIYCSRRCSYQDFESHIDWPSDLPERVEKSSMNAVARVLGVSGKSVRFRLIHHHGYQEDFVAKKVVNWPADLAAYCIGRKTIDIAKELGVSVSMVTRKLREQRGSNIRNNSDRSTQAASTT